MRGNSAKIITTIIGVVTALAITFSQFFYYQAAELCKKEVKTEKHEKKSSESESVISVPSNSVLSSVSFDFTNKIILLFEITFEEEKRESLPPKVPISLGKYFQTLFHIIISPNAP